jgi:hypothetical protein
MVQTEKDIQPGTLALVIMYLFTTYRSARCMRETQIFLNYIRRVPVNEGIADEATPAPKILDDLPNPALERNTYTVQRESHVQD